MTWTIANGANTPINLNQGTLPNVSGAMQDWFQKLTFGIVTKTDSAFQVIETAETITFQGVIQPFSERQLLLKPEGERAWSWYSLHADPVLKLQVDDVVTWNGKQTRVMTRKSYDLYGYIEYTLIQDFTGAGPIV